MIDRGILGFMDEPLERSPEDEWQDEGLAAVQVFAGTLRGLHKGNP